MSGITDLFAIGASGTRAYRAAMGAVSENIVNATTEGYNRRTVVLAESSASATTSVFYKSGVAFGGVETVAIARKNDEYLDLAARVASGNFQSADARATWLGNVQTALDDGSLGVGQQLTSMFASMERLAASPSDRTLRANALFAIEQVGTSFKQASTELTNVKTGMLSEAGNEVVALNDALARVANANEALRRAVPGSSNAAQLMDQRDQALADVSKRVEVSVTFGDNGTANVSYQGATIVNNIVPSKFGVAANADGTLKFSITTDGTTTDVAQPLTGSLSGLAQSATVAAQRTDQLNTLAVQFRDDMNTWHKAGYLSKADGSGVYPPGTDIVGGTDASNLSVLITNTDDLAVRSGTTANGNLVAIASIRGTAGVENGWTSIISQHANLLNATKAEQAATSARYQQAEGARADVSGVDLDREAADLMRLQQAYEGSARIIQVAKENLQTIFNIF